MKLSMWMIAGWLDKYNPIYHIKENVARISGVRVFSDEDKEFEEQYVYVGLDTEFFSDPKLSESSFLVNGKDIIILQSENINNILNDLLAAFDYYNTWETSLWEESSYKSFQRILDLSDSVLGNPMMLSDADGNVLAISSVYKNEDVNEHWIEARNTNRIPTVVLGSPMRALGGDVARSWTNEPVVYQMPDGSIIIGTFLSADGEDVARFTVLEHRKPINPGDIWLVKILCSVLTSMIGEKKRGVVFRSSSSIIGDLLAGMEIDADLIKKLELKCSSPWQLCVIDNPFRSDTFFARGIVDRLREQSIPCVPMIYDDKVVALVSGRDAVPMVDSILGERERQYYIAGISLTFDDLHDIPVRYEQVSYALRRAGGKPCLYFAEDFAFEYLLSLIGERNRKQGLSHPALARLRRYDADKQTELYETLFQYLLNERSILLGSKAMHIHRNSFMYRVQRIKAITGLELEDPMVRAYLLLSFLLESGGRFS